MLLKNRRNRQTGNVKGYYVQSGKPSQHTNSLALRQFDHGQIHMF